MIPARIRIGIAPPIPLIPLPVLTFPLSLPPFPVTVILERLSGRLISFAVIVRPRVIGRSAAPTTILPAVVEGPVSTPPTSPISITHQYC